ncbi:MULTISPECIES: hypothetical protein [unclassified Lysinibacillus]|uniref:hypothetical protein n=1 Tax=unclassified Lysinibacillus TaxID=2636778 RepID=UPI0037F11FE7
MNNQVGLSEREIEGYLNQTSLKDEDKEIIKNLFVANNKALWEKNPLKDAMSAKKF